MVSEEEAEEQRAQLRAKSLAAVTERLGKGSPP
jgi:hypothetical protein